MSLGDRRKLETKLQREAKEALEACGYLVRRIQSGSARVRRGYMHFAEKGTADLIVQGARFVAWVEMKSPGGAQNDDQEMFEAEIVRRGGVYLTARNAAEAVDKVRVFGGPA